MLDVYLGRKGMSLTIRVWRMTVALRLFFQHRGARWYRRAWSVFLKVPSLDMGVVVVVR
jgi:hypothetical protein